jgi:Calcineurin-like phosphoesterase/Secretion system C-terminal sorting domain
MKKNNLKSMITFCMIILLQFGVSAETSKSVARPIVTRGPYLQMGTVDGITIRWQTDVASDSKITCGTTYGTYPLSVVDNTMTKDHKVRIKSLTTDTKYYYTIGDAVNVLQSDMTNHFTTLPDKNSIRKLRFIAFGDCGNASQNQINVRNSSKAYLGSNDVDAMLLLGDNAYKYGSDSDYQTGFFNMYKDDLLKYWKLYPAPGNHDYADNTGNAGSRNFPYHTIFTVPQAAEIGGLASGVSNYYSYDVGNVHLISLDSYGTENGNRMSQPNGAQAKWLDADLNANTKKWTVVYFHHPPYTKTSHDSDTESELIDVREKFVRILEEKGVDLVICGHAHGYERSYLLKKYYNNRNAPLNENAFNAATHTATGNTQNATYNGTANSCPYVYDSGKYNHGTVYTVSGSSGALGGKSSGYPHNCMFFSNESDGGSFYFEVEDNRLDAKCISYNSSAPSVPVIRDQFTIFKDVNKTKNLTVAQNAVVTLTASWVGNYKWTNNNAITRFITAPTATLGTTTYEVKDANSCIKDTFKVTVTSSLSTDKFEYDNKNILFPNPTADKITVKGEVGSFESYIIQNIEGKTVQNGSLLRSNEIDLGKLPAGIYIVKVKSDYNTLVKKIIKN